VAELKDNINTIIGNLRPDHRPYNQKKKTKKNKRKITPNRLAETNSHFNMLQASRPHTVGRLLLTERPAGEAHMWRIYQSKMKNIRNCVCFRLCLATDNPHPQLVQFARPVRASAMDQTPTADLDIPDRCGFDQFGAAARQARRISWCFRSCF